MIARILGKEKPARDGNPCGLGATLNQLEEIMEQESFADKGGAIYCGVSNIEMHLLRADAVKECGGDIKAAAAKLQGNARNFKRSIDLLASMESFDVSLTGNDLDMRIGTFKTAKGFQCAAETAVKKFAGTLRNLELPGYFLSGGGKSVALHSLTAKKGGVK